MYKINVMKCKCCVLLCCVNVANEELMKQMLVLYKDASVVKMEHRYKREPLSVAYKGVNCAS